MASDPQPYLVTWGFKATSLAAAKIHADAMYTTWVNNLRSATSSEVTLREIRMQYNDGIAMQLYTKNAASIGTGGTGVLPSNCSVLVKKLTGVGGRQNQGRNFWPSMVAEGSVDARGLINAATVTAFQNAFNAVWTDLSTPADSDPVILHSSLLTPTLLIGLAVAPLIATQRRRMR
jgi:hypothetical protein